jgi:GNAT superfamily N-acetyltransferase
MLDARGPLGLTAAQVRAAFMPDGFENIYSIVTPTPQEDWLGWRIAGDSTVDGVLVAKFLRTLQSRDGRIVANHARLMVEPHFVRKGYAKALLRSSFAFYQQIGVSYVALDAFSDGALVWPRLGRSLHG